MIFGKPAVIRAAQAVPTDKARREISEHDKNDGAFPKIGDSFATAYVAITFVITMYSGLFGIYPILLLYAIWLPRFRYKGQFVLHTSKDIFWVTLYAGYCLLSVIWSDYRAITFRTALELFSTLACAVIIGRTVTTESLIKGLMIGAVLILMPLISSSGFSFNGFFGSKNEAGFVSEIGIYASVIFACSNTPKIRRALFSAGPLALCLFCLALSSSASSDVSLVIAIAVSFIAYIVGSMPRNWRKPSLLLVAFLAMIAIGVAYSLNLQEAMLQGLGKNSTLTGRTFLWEEGIKMGLRHPVLGNGYSAFWVIGRPEAENYWYQFAITGKSGFHFHNLYIQTFVDLGAIGFLMILATIFLNFVRSTQRLIKNGPELKGCFCLGLAFMLFIRAFVEVDFIQPFTIGTVLFFIILPHLAAGERPENPNKINIAPLAELPKKSPISQNVL